MNFMIAEGSSGNAMNTLFYVIVGAALFIFLFRAGIAYPRYKRSLFSHIYDNYLIDYFYKLNVMQDTSHSGLLKKLIGHHRLVYANITNKEGKLSAQVLTLIHSKGILSIAYLITHGALQGTNAGDWYVKREEDGQLKKYRLENPSVYLREYIKHLHEVNEGKEVQSLIAINDDCDTSGISCTIPVVKYSEVIDHIKTADCGYGLNDTEIDALFEKLGGKINHK